MVELYNSDKDLFASYGDVVTLKRRRDDQDKDEEPSAGSNRETKRRRPGKEESLKEATQKESKSTNSSKGATGSQPKSSGKPAQAEEHGPRVDDLEEPSHQEFETGNDDVSPVREVTDVDARLWNLPGSQTPDRELNKTKTVVRPDLPQSLDDHLAQTSGHNPRFIEVKFLEVYGVWHKLSMTSMPIREHITRDQNVRDSMDMLPTWKLQKMSTQDIRSLLLPVSRSWSSLVINIWKRLLFEGKTISCTDLQKMTPYTAYTDIQGIIYQDDMDRNCLMSTDELHKFSDSTLNHVRTALNDIATGIQMEYLPKRK
ncbi:hypothetical protein Tco_0751885 [Tanacetum coccineum]|uniref:Uncharacterized protein n=1 Tax=Tanacetum coccineum TaxID=301880 RepID=A0ABQ4Z5A3_9ASTR